MSEPIIKVAGIGKKFIIGHQQVERYTALRDVITNGVKKVAGNARMLISPKKKLNGITKEEFWALKDISFNVAQGERLGIIGRNGAGKSTLLKLLSRITDPTEGSITITGRVASLLEVGTGFHPELSGRENIFLNGAILGMTRAEIRKKFDEIVDFAEIEKFLDTPVKRYSSGMYVRLAFSVAAHLEPEILVVDEVLAVGDAQFQQKCLGKMEDVSKQHGRTVLFVSHNLPTIKKLCTSIIYLKQGRLIKQGGVEETIAEYLSENKAVGESGIIPADFFRKHFTGQAFFRKIFIANLNNEPIKEVPYNQPFKIIVELEVLQKIKDTLINVFVSTPTGEMVLFLADCADSVYRSKSFTEGIHRMEIVVDAKLLPLNYDLSAGLSFHHDGTTIDWVENVYGFQVSRIGIKKGEDYPWEVVHGFVEGNSEWHYS
jgi:lipopolysaccharide transport system ATP-binding protein